MYLPLIVAAKAHAHAVPSRAADAELQSGLRRPAGLVVNSVIHIEACGRLALGLGDRSAEMYMLVFFPNMNALHVHTFVAFR